MEDGTYSIFHSEEVSKQMVCELGDGLNWSHNPRCGPPDRPFPATLLQERPSVARQERRSRRCSAGPRTTRTYQRATTFEPCRVHLQLRGLALPLTSAEASSVPEKIEHDPQKCYAFQPISLQRRKKSGPGLIFVYRTRPTVVCVVVRTRIGWTQGEVRNPQPCPRPSSADAT